MWKEFVKTVLIGVGGSLLLFLTIDAYPAEVTPVVNMASYHFDRDAGYNEQNYGLALETTYFQGGFYRNSEYHTSLYGMFKFELTNNVVSPGIMAAAVTGYERAPVVLLGGLTLRYKNVRFTIVPPVHVDGKNVGVVAVQFIVR